MTNLLPVNMTSLLDGFFTPARLPGWDWDQEAMLSPRTEILESDKNYMIRLDMPGVNKDDLSIEVEDQVLTIKAQREFEEQEGYRHLRSEHAGRISYERSFNLGRQIDVEKIKAELRDGVLTVVLPKTGQALARRIEVR